MPLPLSVSCTKVRFESETDATMSLQPARSRATAFPKMAGSTYGAPLLNKQSAPVEWAALMYELEDAQEH